MTTLTSPSPPASAPLSTDWTAADLVDRFGPIPLWRLRLDALAGAATERDVIDIHAREKRLYELVDGVLLEKPWDTWKLAWRW